jgi:hypothetical protein
VPILLGLLATASIGLTVQTIRIEGLRIWPIKITGLKVERDQWRSAEHDWRRAAEIMRGSYDALHQALGVQRAAVDQLKADEHCAPGGGQGGPGRSGAARLFARSDGQADRGRAAG